MKTPTTNQYKEIVLDNTPLIDVRAPIEFSKGAFLNAVNLPIMNDEERHLVGIKYKEVGPLEATELGHQLVSGSIKEERILAWTNYIKKNPTSMIYCFRGGSRSQISQKWITGATGKEITRLEGGYKAFRNYLIDQLEPEQQTSKPILLSGFTGSGKTILLKKLENAIDLEGIANHRGSSFGNQITPQPSQINFENNLAYNIIKHNNKGYQHMILEDEGTNVGRRFLPLPLANYFKTGPLVLMDVPLEERVHITFMEYVDQALADFKRTYGDEAGINLWHEYIIESLKKIYKRLGDERYKQILGEFNQAYDFQLSTGILEQHQSWVELLLKDYYDPMYDYQIKKRAKEILFKGNTEEVFTFLKSMNKKHH